MYHLHLIRTVTSCEQTLNSRHTIFVDVDTAPDDLYRPGLHGLRNHDLQRFFLNVDTPGLQKIVHRFFIKSQSPFKVRYLFWWKMSGIDENRTSSLLSAH